MICNSSQLLDKKTIYISYINIILLRRKYNRPIPDAIIAATAFAYFIPLITADKNFSRSKEIETSIYKIS